MMKDRNFLLTKEEEELIHLSDLSVGFAYLKKAQTKTISLGSACTTVYDNTLLLFLDINYDETKRKEKMISYDQAKQAIEKWKEEFSTCKFCILISPNKLSPDAKREIMVDNLSLISHEFLMLCVGRHDMVPKHTALSKEESQKFLTSRKILLNQLPHLKKGDAVSVYYGFQVETIVKIDRPGNVAYFRVVVDS